ncbi:MAG: hypothetical protein DMF64_15735 [Acidobacteria bacterium]|nr:MAG: hypothetical protein DMF64_15735 [Acidobacteriota bacterium]
MVLCIALVVVSRWHKDSSGTNAAHAQANVPPALPAAELSSPAPTETQAQQPVADRNDAAGHSPVSIAAHAAEQAQHTVEARGPAPEAGSRRDERAATESPRELDEARVERRERDEAEAKPIIVRHNGREIRLEQDPDGDLVRNDQPAEAVRWYLQKRLPTGMKQLPVDRYFDALEKTKLMKQYSTATQTLAPSEAEAAAANVSSTNTKGQSHNITPNIAGGSSAGVLGTWTNLGPGNVGGRTRALVIDPTNANIMYAGAVDGGIWKTTDGGASWNPLNDFLPNIAVTCMVFDPTDHNTIYAGTGEGFFNADAIRGAGIFKTTDAGAHWNRLPATNNSNFFFVNKLAISPADHTHLYAATGTGVMRSLNSGASWTLVLSVPTVAGSTTGVRGAMDLAMRTDQATDYIFAAAGTTFNAGEPQSHIFRNTDAGGSGTWTDVYTETNMGRTSLAIAPSNQNVIYAMSDQTPVAGSNYNLGLLGVFRSTSSGNAGTWTTQVRNNSANKLDTLLLSNPVNAVLVECGFGAVNQFLNQGWYHNDLAVDPTDENKVWAGGTDVWRSDNGGVNWGVASYWWFQGNGTPPNNGDPQLVHADNHILVFAPGYNGTTNQTLYVGDDGGIYKTDNAKDGNVGYVNGTTPSGGTVTSTSPICGNEFTPGGFYTVPSPVIWGPLNNGYQVSQFNQGLPYPDGTSYFGGTQDNGTNRGTDAGGPNQWARIIGGDGGYVAIDPTNTNILYGENTGLTFQKSTNGGASFAAARTGLGPDTFPFYTVFLMDPSNHNRLWIGGTKMWRTDNAAASWGLTSQVLTSGSITAIAVAPTNPDHVLAGTASGRVNKTLVGTTATSATIWTQNFTPRGNGNGQITWLAFDPTNENIAYCTISNFNGTANANGTNAGHVFKSTDGGTNWTLIDGTQTANNLNAIPDVPADTIVVDPNNTQRLYVGTDLGVFVTLDGGANWYKEVTGFSNVQTQTLTALNNGGITSLYAFTYGRGAYKVTVSNSCASISPNTTQNFPAEGGTGTVTITATNGCGWTATNNSGFLAINTGQTGNGNGTVTYTVAPNASTGPRSGTIVVAGTVVNITQDAAPANSIIGQITNGTSNAGVGGVTVTLSGAGAGVTMTNAAGGYSFTGLTPGASYTVTPSGGALTYTPTSKSVASLSGNAVEDFVGSSGPLNVPAAQGALIISEFRLRGSAGANDEFIELYNNSNAPITVNTNDNSLGWAVAASDGAPRFIIPNLTVIPARGHYLAANTGTGGYSLSNYGGTGAAAPDVTYTTDIPDDSGLTLFSTSDPNNFTEAYRLDSVGFTGEPNVLAREGAGLAAVGANNVEYAYVRKQTSGTPQDTGDNAQDFALVSTTAGVINGVQSQLGAPGPENLASGVLQRNATVKASLVDFQCSGTSVNPLSACARVRVVTPDPGEPTNSTLGTLKIRRKFTNSTGGTITRLRFRVVDITTLNSPGFVSGGGSQADLRVINSSDSTVTLTDLSTTTLKGTTREVPPTQSSGGGLNSSMALTVPVSIAPGNSVNVEFNLGVMQSGNYRFFINVESDTSNPAAPINVPKVGTTKVSPTSSAPPVNKQ